MTLTFGCSGFAADSWRIDQHSHVVGKQSVQTSPGLFKIVNPGFSFTAIGKTSEQKVFIFNPKSKVIYENPIDTWGSFMENTILPMHSQNLMHYEIKWKKRRQFEEKSFHYTEFVAENTISGKKLSGVGAPNYDGMIKVKATCKVCDDIKADPSFAKSLSHIYGFPELPSSGMPVAVSFIDSHSGKVTLLETSKIERKPLFANDFAVPTKFKKTKNGAEVILAGEGTGILEDLAGSLGGSSK